MGGNRPSTFARPRARPGGLDCRSPGPQIARSAPAFLSKTDALGSMLEQDLISDPLAQLKASVGVPALNAPATAALPSAGQKA